MNLDNADVQMWFKDTLWAIVHSRLPRPSQNSVHLLVPPRNLGKVRLESLFPELSNHVRHLGSSFCGSAPKIRKTTKKCPKKGKKMGHKFSFLKFGVMWRPYFAKNFLGILSPGIKLWNESLGSNVADKLPDL